MTPTGRSLASAVAGALLFAGAATASAQVDAPSPIAIGISGAITTNYHELGAELEDAMRTDARRTGGQYGVAAHAQLTPVLGLAARVVVDSRPAEYDHHIESMLLLPGNEDVVIQRVVDSHDVSFSMTSAELMASARVLSIAPGVSVTMSLGGAIGFVNEGRHTHVRQLFLPENSRLVHRDSLASEDDGRRFVYARDAEIPNLVSTRLSLKGGVGLDLELPLGLLVRPAVAYDYGLTGISSDDGTDLGSLVYQLDILVGL